MQTATINVRYINPPKGKGPASVKDETGKYWKFWTRDIPLESFQQGGTYLVGYKTEQYNGEAQYYITELTGASTQSAPQKTNGAAHTNGNGQRDEFIFVCGGINHAIAAGKVEPIASELVPTIEAFRDAYRQTFGK